MIYRSEKTEYVTEDGEVVAGWELKELDYTVLRIEKSYKTIKNVRYGKEWRIIKIFGRQQRMFGE